MKPRSRSSVISRTATHKRIRDAWVRRIAAGAPTFCARCQKPIAAGDPWDLGHVDGGGPFDYAGPEHIACNRSTARRRARPDPPRPQSRKW